MAKVFGIDISTWQRGYPYAGATREGVKFAISNLMEHKGKENTIFKTWAEKYNVYDISSNYISYHDNKTQSSHREVLVTNYKRS